MSARKILDELNPRLKIYNRPDLVQRRLILKQTLNAFSKAVPLNYYHLLAAANLERWANEVNSVNVKEKVQIFSGDWGEVTRMLTKTYGVCFAVLNMANAYIPGGGYIEGMIAQEENMFRRTDCHFQISSAQYDESSDCYLPAMTELLSAKNGEVYLDNTQVRVCIRGPEDLSVENLGYTWLEDDEIFPFFELRASAQDLRGGAHFSLVEARRRIAAQFDTLRSKDIHYAVLSAFGCGAFLNPPDKVANLYKEEIYKRADDFALIAFAIFAPGYGSDNYTPFVRVFGKESAGLSAC